MPNRGLAFINPVFRALESRRTSFRFLKGLWSYTSDQWNNKNHHYWYLHADRFRFSRQANQKKEAYSNKKVHIRKLAEILKSVSMEKVERRLESIREILTGKFLN